MQLSGPGKIYWLASYPKSGNTWMRILLTNYLHNADTPADINALDGGPIASGRQVFDDNVGIEASDLTADEIERYRPLVYEQLSAQATEPLFLKVHDAYTRTPEGMPLISKRATAGVIYIIRNPLDVAVSFAHHSASTLERIVNKMGDTDFCFVDKPQRLHNQLRQRLLSWSGHVTSWVDEPDLRVHIVRYEDLKKEPEATFSKVVTFCGLEVDQSRIEKAVKFSSFEEVQRQEREHGFQEKMPQSVSFFRKGEAGSWKETMPPELEDKLISENSEVMRRFGYIK